MVFLDYGPILLLAGFAVLDRFLEGSRGRAMFAESEQAWGS